MSASITDLFAKASNGTAPVPTTLSAQKLNGATSATITLSTGWPTDTAIHFILYQVDANNNMVAGTETLWKGLLSGTTISSLTLRSGTDTTYPAGSVVQMAPTSAWADDFVTGMIAEHNQLGVHAKINGNTVPSGTDTVTLNTASQTLTNKTLSTGSSWADAINTTGSTTGINPSAILGENYRVANYVEPGTGVLAISSGLIGTFSDIIYYISGKRYVKTSIPNETYTASKDTYVDINTSGTVTYTEVANNAASPALAANSIRVGIVVTNGSAISYIHQGKIEFGVTSTGGAGGKLAISDGKGYIIYPQPNQKVIAGLVRPSALTTGQPGATPAAYNGINNIPFQSSANTNYKVKFYEPVISGITATGSWTIECYLSASPGSYTTRLDEFTMIMIGTANNGLYFELPFNSGSYSGLTYLEFRLRSVSTTGTATMNGDTSTRMGRFTVELV